MGSFYITLFLEAVLSVKYFAAWHIPPHRAEHQLFSFRFVQHAVATHIWLLVKVRKIPELIEAVHG